ncbi:MAG: endonuclease/exonuclease/phosphatase family protein [Candidatus Marinimicrobia bacterium]|nr:endonuclease/exonuclease/phosphatase family protein [Candidatus Neomarinimicrobiota bacterium]
MFSCAINIPEEEDTNYPAFNGGDTLDIMTWNLELFPKNGNSSIEYLKNAITAMQPDIIALQEISSETSLQQLTNQLGNYDYYLGEGGGNWGLAFLYQDSLITLDTTIYEIYTNMFRPFPRPPLVMEALWQGEKIVIINNHLKAGSNSDDEERREEANQLLHTYIQAHFDNVNIVLLGDLNDILTDVVYENVFQLFIDDSLLYKFTDMYIAEGSNLNWSYPSWPSHLDHILISNELFDNHIDTRTVLYDTYLEGRWSEYEEHISDHRPVSITLIIEGD